MILLDSDVLVDLLRQYPPAIAWFDALHEDEEQVTLALRVSLPRCGHRQLCRFAV